MLHEVLKLGNVIEPYTANVMPDDVIQWKLYTIFCRTQETLATNLAYDKASKSAPTRKCRREGRVTKSSDIEISIHFEHMES